ncbi:winged helix-turn-helix transcriptional regulator [Leptospira biflexa]|uniref:winged helix-turn-helix transcriptional regulator n=1 Tax=Leptospira biflexa TaxID=172 RepID=UPI001AF0212B|nr:helix-turn-helix domain-containing protein [Leptospira biflexa]
MQYKYNLATYYVAVKYGKKMSTKIKAKKKIKSNRPIMLLLDLLGSRWVLRILWELKDEAFTFRELQVKCENLSPTILNDRLKSLRNLNLVETSENGYSLSNDGKELLEVLGPLNSFAKELYKK